LGIARSLPKSVEKLLRGWQSLHGDGRLQAGVLRPDPAAPDGYHEGDFNFTAVGELGTIAEGKALAVNHSPEYFKFYVPQRRGAPRLVYDSRRPLYGS
jgi:hypothetical protein